MSDVPADEECFQLKEGQRHEACGGFRKKTPSLLCEIQFSPLKAFQESRMETEELATVMD